MFSQHTQHILTKAGKGPAVDFGLTAFAVQPTGALEHEVATFQQRDCVSSKHRFSLGLLFPVQRGTQSSTVRTAGAVVAACPAIATFHGLRELLSFCIHFSQEEKKQMFVCNSVTGLIFWKTFMCGISWMLLHYHLPQQKYLTSSRGKNKVRILPDYFSE